MKLAVGQLPSVECRLENPGALGDEEARQRFRKETLALSCLNHPNIATVFDFDRRRYRLSRHAAG